MRGCGLDTAGSGQGPLVSWGEYGNEPSGSLKTGNFLNGGIGTFQGSS